MTKLTACLNIKCTEAQNHTKDCSAYGRDYPSKLTKAQEKIDCGECGAEMVLRNSKYGLFYGCSRYPECKGTHGAHQNSGKPLGIPTDQETKKWRVKAHAKFDSLWESRGLKRQEAYKLLQTTMGMTPEEAHIGRFTKEECQKLLVKLIQTINND